MSGIVLIGTGYVADLYAKSLKAFPEMTVKSAYDRNAQRLQQFCKYWNFPAASGIDEAISSCGPDDVIVNLTNPAEHFSVSKRCLEASRHVYSEKPLAMSMDEAKSLAVLSKQNKVLLASAPCSVLSQAAQTMRQAVHDGVAGRPLLVYAELDDGFVPQAPYRNWLSESGAPWPFEDEFRVGCTIEHAGYSLTWLIAMFGSVQKVVAASASLIPDKERVGGGAPDFATSTLFFENGIVARLTCSIVAPHDHKLRVIGTKGVVEVRDVWHNSANVFFRPRFKIRNRLIDSPIPRKVKPLRSAHVKSWSSGSASMNFALGPHEMITSIREKRPCHLSTEFALHVTEVTLAINDGCGGAGMQTMTTRCAPLAAPNANS